MDEKTERDYLDELVIKDKLLADKQKEYMESLAS